MKIFLCGDVMTGRGLDQVLPYPCAPRLHERYTTSATSYVRLAEPANGPIPAPVDFSFIRGAALDEFARARPDARIFNLETSITRSDAHVPKGINYRMSPENSGCLAAGGVDCCVLGNNHVLDWGRSGLLDTLATLERFHRRQGEALMPLRRWRRQFWQSQTRRASSYFRLPPLEVAPLAIAPASRLRPQRPGCLLIQSAPNWRRRAGACPWHVPAVLCAGHNGGKWAP
jgi:hypothetical protein